MSWQEQEGALVDCNEGDAHAVQAAMVAALEKLGFERSNDEQSSLSCQPFVAPSGACS